MEGHAEQQPADVMCETRDRRPRVISFDRRKELMNLAQRQADAIVQARVAPDEVRFFQSLVSILLDKSEF